MSEEEVMFVPWVALLFVAFAGLFLAVRLHSRLRMTQAEEVEWQQPPAAFDARSVSARLRSVRQNYVAALHFRPHPLTHPRQSLAAARLMVSNCSYFHHVRQTEQPEQHAD